MGVGSFGVVRKVLPLGGEFEEVTSDGFAPRLDSPKANRPFDLLCYPFWQPLFGEPIKMQATRPTANSTRTDQQAAHQADVHTYRYVLFPRGIGCMPFSAGVLFSAGMLSSRGSLHNCRVNIVNWHGGICRWRSLEPSKRPGSPARCQAFAFRVGFCGWRDKSVLPARCRNTGTTRVMKVVDKQKALSGGVLAHFMRARGALCERIRWRGMSPFSF